MKSLEIIQERLNTRTHNLKLYEKTFNLLKNTQQNETKNDYIFDPTINYLNNNHLVNFGLKKIRDEKKKLNELLFAELNNFNYSKFNDKNNFKDISLFLLNKYNSIIKDITEDIWVIYTKDSKQFKYELKDNEFVIDNSILIKNKSDKNLIFFLKNIYMVLKNLGKQFNYNVHTKFYDDEYHDICWLIFVFSKN